MPDFLQQLKHIRSQQLKWRLLRLLTGAILVWAAANCIFALIERVHLWREPAIALLMLLVLAGLGAVLLWRVAGVWRRRPSYRTLGRLVEAEHPELMDVLNCAVEIAAKPAEQHSAFERLVMQRAEQQARELSFENSLRTRPGLKYRVMLLLLIGLLISAWSRFWPPWIKAADAVADFLAGTHSGVSVEPGTVSVPAGSDVTVRATIHRGERRAQLLLEENGQSSRLQMRDNGARHELQLYHLTQPLRYRVRTPSLASAWHRIEVFDPPKLRRSIWKVSPPEYTQLEPFEQEGLELLKIPEGSRIDAEFWISPKEARIELIGESLRLAGAGSRQIRRLAWTPEAGGDFYLELSNAQGHRTKTESFKLELILDEPPLAEWVQPAQDVEATTGANIGLRAFAADDYGVAQAVLKLSCGGRKEEFPVFTPPAEREKYFEHALALEQLALQAGDVISYYLEVADNKQPRPQWSRSEIYFIEIVADEQPPEQKPESEQDSAGQSDAKKRELPIRALIAETKRLIRKTFVTESLAGAEREKEALTLLADALALRKQLSAIQQENQNAFQLIDGVNPGRLLLEALEQVQDSEDSIQGGRYFEAIDRQHDALRDLVQLYQLLKKQTEDAEQAASQGSSGEAQSGRQGEPAEQSAQSAQNELMRELNQFQNALEQVEGLSREQRELNAQLNRAGRQNAGAAQAGKLSAQQGGIAERTQSLRDELYNNTGRIGDIRGLELAAGEMRQVNAELDAPDFSGAETHGLRAAEALELSAQQLRGELRRVAGEMVRQLEQRSRGLGQLQAQVQDATQRAQGEQFDHLREAQGQINAQINSLLAGIERAAFAIEPFERQGAEELRGAGVEARRQGMPEAGQRAQNALLYEAQEQAAQEQQKVAEGLSRLGNRLQAAAAEMTGGENAALAQLLSKLMGARQSLAQLNQQQLEQVAKELAGDLQGVSESRGVAKLDYLVHRLQNWGDGGLSVLGAADLDWILGDSINILKGMIWEQVVDETLRRSRGDQQPPQKYRKLVEEYYRRIAEEL